MSTESNKNIMSWWIGYKMLLIHIGIAFGGWMIIDTKPLCVQIIIFEIISVTLIVLWYNAIRNAAKDRFLKSIIVSLYFIIPSILSAAGYYYSFLHPEGGIGLVIYDVCWMTLNYPFSLLNIILQHQTTDNIWIQISMPIITMLTLVLINFIEFKLKSKSVLSLILNKK